MNGLFESKMASVRREYTAKDIEVLEGLEQLRWLQSGLRIKVGVIPHAAKGIDTPEDYDAFVERCRFRYTDNHLDPLSE